MSHHSPGHRSRRLFARLFAQRCFHTRKGAPHGFANGMCSQKRGGKIELPMHEEGGNSKPMDEQALRQMSLEILTEIKEWRRAHPRAIYVQREDEIHKRLMQLEARL